VASNDFFVPARAAQGMWVLLLLLLLLLLENRLPPCKAVRAGAISRIQVDHL
jgi:hypothetical protein